MERCEACGTWFVTGAHSLFAPHADGRVLDACLIGFLRSQNLRIGFSSLLFVLLAHGTSCIWDLCRPVSASSYSHMFHV